MYVCVFIFLIALSVEFAGLIETAEQDGDVLGEWEPESTYLYMTIFLDENPLPLDGFVLSSTPRHTHSPSERLRKRRRASLGSYRGSRFLVVGGAMQLRAIVPVALWEVPADVL